MLGIKDNITAKARLFIDLKKTRLNLQNTKTRLERIPG